MPPNGRFTPSSAPAFNTISIERCRTTWCNWKILDWESTNLGFNRVLLLSDVILAYCPHFLGLWVLQFYSVPRASDSNGSWNINTNDCIVDRCLRRLFWSHWPQHFPFNLRSSHVVTTPPLTKKTFGCRGARCTGANITEMMKGFWTWHCASMCLDPNKRKSERYHIWKGSVCVVQLFLNLEIRL